MDNEYQRKIISLLEVMLANQEISAQRQLESLELQRIQFEKAKAMTDRAEKIQSRAEDIQKRAKQFLYIFLPLIIFLIIALMLMANR